ncbi:MAG TPA: methylenetetrahydrofolate reductase, partial [Sphingomonas sp.]|nr:methylenetetrahydrofolate reductase [Sphingomonas sp.]
MSLVLDPGAPLFADVAGDIDVSFEFFPPKTEKMEETLWESIQTLSPLGPRFVSVTYGAGGSTRERTHNTVARIARETPIAAAAHLTCVEATREEIDAVAEEYWAAGVRHIVALRGDPPEQGQRYTPHPEGYVNAAELVAGLK